MTLRLLRAFGRLEPEPILDGGCAIALSSRRGLSVAAFDLRHPAYAVGAKWFFLAMVFVGPSRFNHDQATASCRSAAYFIALFCRGAVIDLHTESFKPKRKSSKPLNDFELFCEDKDINFE